MNKRERKALVKKAIENLNQDTAKAIAKFRNEKGVVAMLEKDRRDMLRVYERFIEGEFQKALTVLLKMDTAARDLANMSVYREIDRNTNA